MNKTISSILIITFVIGAGVIFSGGLKLKNTPDGNTVLESVQNVEIKDGIQYITITAKGGYSPRTSTARGGIPTKLIIKTNNTYDCSASLAIHSLKYQQILQPNGQEIIDIGTPNAGETLRGVCGMGMYSFVVNFTV